MLHFTQKILTSSYVSSLVQILDSPVLPRPSRDQLQRLSVKMAATHDLFPKLLILQGVKCKNRQQRGAGGFADVFRGTYRGSKVGLKRLRAYSMISDTEKEALKKVRLPTFSPGPVMLTARSYSISSRFYGNTLSTTTSCSSWGFQRMFSRACLAWCHLG